MDRTTLIDDIQHKIATIESQAVLKELNDMIDEAVFSLMHELDGVFDGDDVVLAVPVDEVNERAEGSGLAGPGTADDEAEFPSRD